MYLPSVHILPVDNMCFINIHINIQIFTDMTLCCIKKQNLLITLFIDTLPLIGK